MNKEALRNLFLYIKDDDVSNAASIIIENNWFNLKFPSYFDPKLITTYPILKKCPAIISVAAYFDSFNVFHFLVSNNADIKLMDDENVNSIGYAIRNNNIDIIKYLFDIDAIDQAAADDCFLFASKFNALGSFKYCLSRIKFNPKASDAQGKLCVHYAALHGNIDFLQLLLDQGCYINERSTTGQTPFMLAAISKNSDTVKFMLNDHNLEMGTTNQYDDNAFILAAAPGRLENMKLMIEKGFADINHQNSNGATALHIASINNRVDVVKYLLTLPNIDVTIHDAGKMNPLFRSFTLLNEEVIKVLYDYMKAHNPDPSKSIAIDGESSLMHLATEMDNLEYLDWLVNTMKEDVNATGCQNPLTPLQLAIEKGYLQSLDFLLDIPGRKINAFTETRRWNVGAVIVSLTTQVNQILQQKGKDILESYIIQKKKNDEEIAKEKAEKKKQAEQNE